MADIEEYIDVNYPLPSTSIQVDTVESLDDPFKKSSYNAAETTLTNINMIIH